MVVTRWKEEEEEEEEEKVPRQLFGRSLVFYEYAKESERAREQL